MNEEWRDILGFEGFYQVSSTGRVRSLDRNVSHYRGDQCELKGKCRAASNTGPYKTIVLSKNGSQTSHLVHRLVANAFVPNPENKPNVNHKDFNPANNCTHNLEWTTQVENIEYSVRAGRNPKGSQHGCAKLNESDVLKIRSYPKSFKWLADHYDVSYTTIKRIRKRKNWSHI